ncbi:MAG: hypothetical protein LBE70_00550 [Nitrososphaerota archaeon]|nr:hypothetical protein [Nitrososphaerota archaeon]
MKKGIAVQLSAIIPFLIGIYLIVESVCINELDGRLRLEDSMPFGAYLFFSIVTALFILSSGLMLLGTRLNSQKRRKINQQKNRTTYP